MNIVNFSNFNAIFTFFRSERNIFLIARENLFSYELTGQNLIRTSNFIDFFRSDSTNIYILCISTHFFLLQRYILIYIDNLKKLGKPHISNFIKWRNIATHLMQWWNLYCITCIKQNLNPLTLISFPQISDYVTLRDAVCKLPLL